MSFRRYQEFIPILVVLVLLSWLLLAASAITAQQIPSPGSGTARPQQPPAAVAQLPPTDPQLGRDRTAPRDQMEEKLEQDRKKAMNKQRQASLQKDTDKLYQLATELKGYVDKSNEHTLSLDVIKKAEEVEKLAKKVKEKMKETY